MTRTVRQEERETQGGKEGGRESERRGEKEKKEENRLGVGEKNGNVATREKVQK